MSPKKAIAFVDANGVVLESGRGDVPSIAEEIAGEPTRGSWWAHPKANTIFACTRAVRESADVSVCRLISGKVTYVHRRLWPALARLAGAFDADRLAVIKEDHSTEGRHKISTTAFVDWIPEDVASAAAMLTEEDAGSLLPVLPDGTQRTSKRKA